MNKILIIRLSSLGDIVLTSPLVRSLRSRFPRAQIDFLVKEQYADLVKFNPNLSSVIEMRLGDWDELQTLVNQVQSEKYDLLVDLHNSLRSRYIRILSKARRRVIVNKRSVARFMLVNFKWNFYDGIIPVTERYLETCAPFGPRGDGNGPEVFIPEQTIETMVSYVSKFKLERYKLVFGFAPSAKHFTKRWLPERFIELGAYAAKELNAKVIIFGGKEEATACEDISQMINMQVGAPASESVAGKISLIESIALLDYCQLVVSNDSGMMHLAQARNRNLVAVFGSTVKEFGFFPTTSNSKVLEASEVKCRPCSHIGRAECPKGHFNCMNSIRVEEVVAAVRSLL
ncbi:MAG: lipopolysaccharide heptosyltransferase II [Ignavibacteriales bacterium]|nr:lipopolysaccharide heptosyltransferase II [Ignavibacteriales bacterium]